MAITKTFTFPVAGATAPNAAQSRPHQQVVCDLTGDGAALTAVIDHNFGFTTAELAEGFPEVVLEALLPSFYTEKPQVTTRAANSVTITVVGAAADKFVRVRIRRPHSGQR